MFIKMPCPSCKGAANFTGTLPEPFEIDCPNCIDGYIRTEIESSEDVIIAKLEQLKTKINQMQADINYIKAKVG